MRMTESQPDRPSIKSGGTYQPLNVDVSHDQVFTGQISFESCNANQTFMIKVTNGEQPAQAAETAKLGLTDDLLGT